MVLENSHKGPALLDFRAPCARPSLRQRDVLLRLVREYGGRLLLVTLDADRQKEIARKMGVESLPSYKLLRGALPRRALPVLLDLLGPVDEHTRHYRQFLVGH